MLFNESTIRKLNNLSMVATKIRSGVIKGERRSTKRGTSIEFADYRDYVAGDDLRRLDWNVYARLDRPFIKLLEEEEDLAVYILIDISKSMNWGEKDTNKLSYALHIAGALGTIALSAGDRIKILTINEKVLQAQYGPIRGPQHEFQMLSFLENIYQKQIVNDSYTLTDLNASLRSFSTLQQRPGLVFLISDMFSPSGYESGLTDLTGRGFELIILHTLSPDEIDTPFAGDLSLIDNESGVNIDVSVDGGIRDAYRHRVSLWKETISKTCLRRDIRYLGISTAEPWEKIVLHEMRKANIVR